ncbi:MFS transporter [Caulobacter sp. Root1455]|uniref:MFS transporter n=1 Tax=Caulobacter sp. Root1455 TaxID=1736465 RepID=UPI000AAE9D51|nr:MFS transporter [Caulobacter sp. Root1455]
MPRISESLFDGQERPGIALPLDHDPRRLLDERPMGRLQWTVVVLCVLLNALDGFDVLSISFASPGIAKDWGVDRAALGLVLSMELIGMAIGSVLLGGLADRVGRRGVTLGCLATMSLGMAAAPFVWDVPSLSLVRLVTGLGIGGMLACTNAMVAEFTNRRNRYLAVALMAAGYPLGAVLGGSVASVLLASGGWRDVFIFGAACSALCLPLTALLLPESIGFLVAKPPKDALARINRLLVRMGHPVAPRLPSVVDQPRAAMSELFKPGLLRTTLLLTAGYFAHIMTFYFILKWIPKLVVDMGYAPSTAGGVLVWANVGGLTGAVLLSVLTLRFPLRPLVITAMLASVVMVSVFGRPHADLFELRLVAAVAGFCTNAGVVGFYALLAQAFPTPVRAGGTGFAIGVGRGGAALGPVVAGLMFAQGFGLFVVACCMAAGSLLAALAVLALPSRPVEAR